jgi:tetratricopeptide (TPR) repeat protein
VGNSASEKELALSNSQLLNSQLPKRGFQELRRWALGVAALGVVLALASFGSAQDFHASHRIPIIPLDLLERPLPIRSGIGAAHDEVSTSSARAQAFYDQGLAYLHSFVWIEAARSFNEALRLDPKLAIAHVGLSYAYLELNRVDASRTSLAQARALASGASAHDRRHIELRALQVAAEGSPRDGSKLAAYRNALDRALAAFSADVELALLRGITESRDPADRGQGTSAGSVPYFERVLKREPGHFAAHHYLTHAHENTGRAAEALEHARAYARRAAQIPHARHMYGHNLRRAGRVDEAIVEFEAADRLQREYFARENVPAEYDWHHHHNLDLLAASYQYLGQMNKAETLLKESFSLPSNLVVQVFNKRQWPEFLRARGRIDEAWAAARVLIAHPHPLIQATGHIEAGYTQLAAGRVAEAASESNTALRMLRAGPEGASMAAADLLGLQGEISLRTAQREKGRQVLEEVARRVRAAPGPDGWSQALFTLEAIARAARAVGDWKLAGRIASQMLEHDAAYGGTHYLLALVADHKEDRAAAIRELELAEGAWRDADPELEERVDVRKRLAALRDTGSTLQRGSSSVTDHTVATSP